MSTKSRSKKKKKKSSDGGFERLDGFLLNAIEDAPDLRDYEYEPALIQLKNAIDPPAERSVLDQGREGACTGFGLAAVVNLLLTRRAEGRRVSPRMLYEMAKKFDEWKGENYSGSSCRGAVRGWHSMGVCSEKLAPYRENEKDWALGIKQAKDARETTLGAYYRVGKRLSDYHAALNEVGVLYASAQVHEGWGRRAVKDGVIPFRGEKIGAHAFALVGYDSDGFWVQNSWGGDWGDHGVALWTYEDWLENIRDAWVLRLALSTPQVWHLSPRTTDHRGAALGGKKGSPKRAEIVGHYVHIDDGKFDTEGKYWSDETSVRQTAELVAKSKKYDHLLLYAHGGLNSIEASARRIVAMKEVFKDNRIYPFHFMYDTGLLEEIKDIIFGRKEAVEARAGGFTDFTDKLIEIATRPIGRAIWRETKQGARSPFLEDGAGTVTLRAFIEAFAKDGARPKKLHIAGHSTGAILLASLLRALRGMEDAPRVQTCCLLAPACPHSDFKTIYRPLLKKREADEFGLGRMRVYNLSEDLELDDTVTALYRKSLLYLVSNAFEEDPPEPLLGMQVYRMKLGTVPKPPVFQIYASDGKGGSKVKTASETHGGFDNDPYTMNDVLRTVLRKANPERPFTQEDLDY